MSNEQNPEVRLTSADILKQIEAAKKELKESGLPITGQIANEINASESTPKEPTKEEVKPEHSQGAAKRVEAPTNEELDFKVWAKKKGIDWTTDDTVLKALHMSDQQFHEKRAKEKVQENGQPRYVPPPPPAYNPQPTYQPMNDRIMNENLARQYNIPPEDMGRLLPLLKDFHQAASQADRVAFQEKMAKIERENQKNSVFRELSSDPVFRNPKVAIEFHSVLEAMQASDPESFELDPNAYKRAYDRALANIGRRDLEGQPLAEGVPPSARMMQPPTTPPRPLGQGSGGGALENENGIDAATFAKAPLEEKKRILEKAGLRPAY